MNRLSKSVFAAAAAMTLLLHAQTKITRDANGRVIVTNMPAAPPPQAPESTPAPVAPVVVAPAARPIVGVEGFAQLPFRTSDGDSSTPRIVLGPLPRHIVLQKGPGDKLFAVRTAPVEEEGDGPFPYHPPAMVSVPRVAAISIWASNGERPSQAAEGAGRTKEKLNYYLGGDREKWQTALPVYGGIAVRGAAKGLGVTETISATARHYRVAIAPGVDPSTIAIEFTGAARVDPDGTLILGDVRVPAPHASTIVRWKSAGHIFFDAGPHDASQELDVEFDIPRWAPRQPAAGEGLSSAFATTGVVAADDDGSVYVAGPAIGGDQDGQTDLAIQKFDAKGNLLYTTFIGGKASEGKVAAISPDGKGNLIVATPSSTKSLPLTHPSGCKGIECFGVLVAKLGPAGELAGSWFASGLPQPMSMAIDRDGMVYVGGKETSEALVGPAKAHGFDAKKSGYYVAKVDPFQDANDVVVYGSYLSTMQPHAIAIDGAGDIIVAGLASIIKIDPRKSGRESLVASRSIGADTIEAVAVDAAGNIYAAGTTQSPVRHGDDDVFVCKFDPKLHTLRWSTLIGGSDKEQAAGIAVDANQNVYVTGSTLSEDFPVISSLHTADGEPSSSHVFAVRLNSVGTHATWSILLGGGGPADEEIWQKSAALTPGGDFIVPVLPWLRDDQGVMYATASTDVRGSFVRVSNCVACTAAPSIAGLSKGLGSRIDVTGSGFSPLAKVLVNGVPASSVFVSPSLIHVRYDAKTTDDDFEVSVVNPDDQSATQSLSQQPHGLGRIAGKAGFAGAAAVIVIIAIALIRRRRPKKRPQPISSGRIPVRRRPPLKPQ
jgi:beta-propeller repeat-containing protein/IPT/TIG domain-containing protein